MDNQDAFEKKDVDEVENKIGDVGDVVVDTKLTRSVLWTLDRRLVSREYSPVADVMVELTFYR